MTNIRYVKIKRPDTEEIKGMVRQFCDEISAEPEQYDILTARLSRMHVFGALNGLLAGIGGYYIIGNKAFFDFIYVKPEHRDKSIAGRLHKMAIEDAKKQGLKRVVIFTRPNTANRYLKIGYREAFHVLEKDITA